MLPFYTGQVPTADDFTALAVKAELASSAGASMIGYGATTVAAILASISAPAVTSVAGKTGAVTLAFGDVSGVAALTGDPLQNFSVKDATGTQHAIPLGQADLRYAPIGGGGGGGVSSVGLTMPSLEFTVSGSPVTSAGALTATWVNQAPHLVLAGPASGAVSGTPVFRSLVPSDIPTLNQNTTGSAGSVTGVIGIDHGGTGQTSQVAALNALTNVGPATLGHVLTKDPATGNALWQASGGSSGVTVAVLGDSLTALNLAQAKNWPDLMATSLNETGSPCKLLNFAVSGYSFYRASTMPAFGGQTPLQACIASAPQVVLVMLGANDLLVGIDGRSLGQVQADAVSLFTALRTALPTAKIIYISELCYDSSNYSPSTLANQGVVPTFMTLRTSGILANAYCTEILTDAVSSATKGAFSNWAAFDSYCRGLAWDGLVTLNYFKTARLGLTLPDLLHPNATGVLNICSQIMVGLGSVSGIGTYLPGLPGSISTISANSVAMFSNLLSPSGSGYVLAITGDGEKLSFVNGFTREYLPGEWFYPYRGKMAYAPITPLSYAARQSVIFRITGVAPLTAVELSVAGGAFTSISLSTDDRGEVLYITDSQGFGGTGTISFRYRIGNSITPIITITINP